MGVKVRTTTVNVRTTLGLQDITIDGLGTASEIKAAMFVAVGATTGSGNPADISIGITDGTTHQVSSAVSQDNVGTTNTNYRGATDEVIMQLDQTDGTINFEASFDSFIDNGVRISVSSGGNGSVLVVLWAGTDVSAEVGNVLLHETVNSSTVETVGFEFDHMIMMMPSRTNYPNDVTANGYSLTFGFCSNEGGGTFTQGALTYMEQDAATDGDPRGQHFSNRVIAPANDGQTAIGATGEITAASSTSFTITTRDVSQTATNASYLIISYGGAVSHWVDNDQLSPTSTGDHDVTDVGFRPQCVIHGLSMFDTADSFESDFQAEAYAIGAFDITNESCKGNLIQDGSATTDTWAISEVARAVRIASTSVSHYYRGTFSQFLSNGYRINYDTANGTTRHWIALAVQADLAYEQEGYRWREDDNNEANATWIAAQDTSIVRNKNVNTRLRVTINSLNQDPPTAQATLQYRQVGDADSEWRTVPLT